MFNKPDYNFDDVNKIATPAFLKTMVCWNKGYDFIISADYVTAKFYHVIQIVLQMCSCDQSLATVAFLWETLSQPQFYKDLTRKTAFFRGGLGSSSIIWDWH